MSGFGVDQGTGATAVAVLRSTGEPGKASPIRGGGCTEKRIRRREPGKIVAVWSSISLRAWAACVRCGEPRAFRGSFAMYYNFVRIHKTLRTTAAMAAGLTSRLWEIGDIVGVLEAWENTT